MTNEEPEIPEDGEQERREAGGLLMILAFLGAIAFLIVLLYFAY